MEEKNLEEIQNAKKIIIEVLKKFDIEVEHVYHISAPSYTQYVLNYVSEYKVSTILKKADKIAAEFPMQKVRIVAPFGDVATLGVEIPNKERRTVLLKDIGSDIISFNGALPVGLGETDFGSSLVIDLAEATHIFISGKTMSGKTTLINSMICSLLFFRKSDFVKFIMIQTEGAELTRYDGIPHLVRPVVKDVNTAFTVLNDTCEELERRLKLLSSTNEGSIIRYNKNHEEKIPYTIVIIDEIVDLVNSDRKRFDALVRRITSVGRYVGIHLILSTRFVSAKVISSTIYSNTPTKIALEVDTSIASRIAIDNAGAEKLLGKGDLLYASRFSSHQPIRAQGAYIGEHDVDCIVSIIEKIEETIK